MGDEIANLGKLRADVVLISLGDKSVNPTEALACLSGKRVYERLDLWPLSVGI
jgi:hypothetical protein